MLYAYRQNGHVQYIVGIYRESTNGIHVVFEHIRSVDNLCKNR